MIEDLYDSIVSISNEMGYLDKVSEVEDGRSLLKWSSNFKFRHNTNLKMYNSRYPVKVFSHCDSFRDSFSYIIKEDGTLNDV